MAGQLAVEELFRALPSPRLRGFVVHLPMVEGDTEASCTRFADDRVRFSWDPERTIGHAFAPVLILPRRVAWDVYLVYAPGVRWTDTAPPLPTVWMHQLRDADPSRRLDPQRLIAQTRRLLEGLIPAHP